MRNLNELNEYRDVLWEMRASGGAVGHAKGGCFKVDCQGVELRIMAGSGGGWDHLSVSTLTRCPSWEEMEHVRKLFSAPGEVWLQFGLPERQHINHHPHCLHWWRPLHREIRLPPPQFVGPSR